MVVFWDNNYLIHFSKCMLSLTCKAHMSAYLFEPIMALTLGVTK